jgi:hypothetical protein
VSKHCRMFPTGAGPAKGAARPDAPCCMLPAALERGWGGTSSGTRPSAVTRSRAAGLMTQRSERQPCVLAAGSSEQAARAGHSCRLENRGCGTERPPTTQQAPMRRHPLAGGRACGRRRRQRLLLPWRQPVSWSPAACSQLDASAGTWLGVGAAWAPRCRLWASPLPARRRSPAAPPARACAVCVAARRHPAARLQAPGGGHVPD